MLASCLPPTAWLAGERAGLTIDPENRALKAPDTREERALLRRIEAVGEDHALVVVLPAAPGASADELEAYRARLGSAPGARSVESLPTREEGAAAFVIELAGDGPGAFALSARAVEEVARGAAPPGRPAALAGLPLVELALAEAVQAESARIVPAVALVLALCLTLVWRSLAATVAVLVPTGIGLAWTGGLRALLGRALDPVSVLLDPVLLTVGVAAGVHVVEAWLAERAAGSDPWEAARRAREALRRPATWAAATTLAGFLALATSPIPAVQDFGLFAGLGSALVTWLGFLLAPSLLALLWRRPPQAASARRARRARSVALVRWIDTRPAGIAAVALVLGTAGALGWSRLGADQEPLAILPASHPVRQDAEQVARVLGGVERFDVLVTAGGAAQEPLRAALIAADLAARPEVGGLAGPPRRGANEDLVLSALLAPGGSAGREALFDALEARWLAGGTPEVLLAGGSVQLTRDSQRLIRGQQRGLLLVLPALALAFWVAFASPRLALVGLVPNVLPCLVVQGALFALGRSATVATALVAAAMLGLVVDNTIHFVHRWRTARACGTGPRLAAARALERAGGAVLRTSLCLAAGFGTGLVGGLSTSREFAALSASIVLLALVACLVLLPALLLGRRRGRATRGRVLERKGVVRAAGAL